AVSPSLSISSSLRNTHDTHRNTHNTHRNTHNTHRNTHNPAYSCLYHTTPPPHFYPNTHRNTHTTHRKTHTTHTHTHTHTHTEQSYGYADTLVGNTSEARTEPLVEFYNGSSFVRLDPQSDV